MKMIFYFKALLVLLYLQFLMIGSIVSFPHRPAQALEEAFALDFTVTDALIHPSEPILYITSKEKKQVYAFNYITRKLSALAFDDPPESLAFGNNELYVSLLKGEHSSYWWEEDQRGSIAVIDPSRFEKKDQLDINLDPYDILVDRDGILYVASGSGQWTYMMSYDVKTKKSLGQTSIRQMSSVELHPVLNRIYAVDSDVFPRDMETFFIENGKFAGGYDSPYHGDYGMSPHIKISTDGKYIFHDIGTIFTSSDERAHDMNYAGKLREGFADIAFDLENQRFFTAVNGKKIHVYRYAADPNSFEPSGTYYTQGEVKRLFLQAHQLIAISQDGQKSFIEWIPADPVLSSQKDLQSFTVNGYEGTIDGNTVFVYVPLGTGLVDLTATFQASPHTVVKVGDRLQESGVSKNNFSKPVTYSIMAEDHSVKEYQVFVNYQLENGPIRYGDVNGDGVMTLDDVQLIALFLQGSAPLIDLQKMVADVNGDQQITEKDAELIRQAIAGSADEFPVLKTARIVYPFKAGPSMHHPDQPVIYIADKDSNALYAIHYQTKEFSFISLPYKPSGFCLSEDGKKLFVVNADPAYLVTEVDAVSHRVLRNLKFEAADYSYEETHRHVYQKDGKLYVILDNWAPELVLFDADTFEKISYSPALQNIGDLVFTQDKTRLYTWLQSGWDAGWAGSNVYKYKVAENGFSLADESKIGYPEMLRDPLDSPLFLLEDKGMLIYKHHALDMNDLNQVIGRFPETIYAVDEKSGIAAGKNGTYHLETFEKVESYSLSEAKALFFDGHGTLYSVKDHFLIPLILEEIKLDSSEWSLEALETRTISARAAYSDGSLKDIAASASYESSQPDVAAVNSNGIVTAKNPGTALITVHYRDKSAVLKVMVGNSLSSIQLSQGVLTPIFHRDVTSYQVTLPLGTANIPTVQAVASKGATVEIISANALPGQTQIKVTAGDGLTTKIYTIQFQLSQYLESDHPYSNRMDRTWTYTLPHSQGPLEVAFSLDTHVEESFDFIYVIDGNGKELLGSPYTGRQLAGKTVIVPTNTVKIRLKSDQTNTGYGFRVIRINELRDGDVNQDGIIDEEDFSLLLASYGSAGDESHRLMDLNADGVIDAFDIMAWLKKK